MHPANDNGAFIIRPSESIPNAYSLSSKIKILVKEWGVLMYSHPTVMMFLFGAVRDGNQVKHYIIHGEHGVFWVTKRKVFRSLQQLVAYYSTYLDDLCSLLTRPCIPVVCLFDIRKVCSLYILPTAYNFDPRIF